VKRRSGTGGSFGRWRGEGLGRFGVIVRAAWLSGTRPSSAQRVIFARPCGWSAVQPLYRARSASSWPRDVVRRPGPRHRGGETPCARWTITARSLHHLRAPRRIGT
jgi:hypothetical protein